MTAPPRIATLLAALLVVHWLSLDALHADETPRPDAVSYNDDIRPILSEKCFACHGPDDSHREADLRLDLSDEALRDLGGYAAIVPGKPDESELIERITSDDEYSRMPPPEANKELTAEQIDLLRRWIEQGATYERHWAYERPVARDPPPVQDTDWPAGPIDRFLLARMEQEGVTPAPDADRITLLRRIYFDLIGLPPEPAEVDAFLADTSPGAYEAVVDRLLASPHFGERLAIVWLDLVRFADTVGYHGDQDHNISPYRDYVIKAFNDNLPFDQFTIEQLAGDLLPEPTLWQQIATGYNRLLQTSHEGGVQPKEYLAKYLADRVRNASQVWLGATMGCAECHNHKYDPYTIEDFYAFGAFFADIDEAEHFRVGSNALPTRRPPEIPAWNLQQYAEIQVLETQLAELRGRDGAEGDSSTAEEIARCEQRKAEIEKEYRLTMITRSIEPREIRVLPRGNWLDDSGPVVEPAIPAFLGSLPVDGRASRLDLAQWLVSPDNPLTARVMVNRLWAIYFGRGLCKSLDDFGGQGVPPDQPELLDWLAVEFMQGNWDIKGIIKRMVTSRAYRQSSVASAELLRRDPDNRLFARQGRFRLPAELVRDNVLAVSGLLNDEIGGPSVKPYQPAGYYQHLNFPKRKYEPHLDARQYRRGLYVHWQRSFLHPMLKAFDAPTREECTAERTSSNTPLASLVLLNDPTFVEAARAFAARILTEGGDTTDERLGWAWRTVLSRPPTTAELNVLHDLLNADLQEYTADPDAASALLEVGMYEPPPSLDRIELAAWTSVARALFNLNETHTRN